MSTPRLDVVKKALRLLNKGGRPKATRINKEGGGYYNISADKINVQKAGNPDPIQSVLHESGHRTRRSTIQRKGKKGIIGDDLYDFLPPENHQVRANMIIEEVKANQAALKALRTAGATTKDIKRFKKKANEGMDGYRKTAFHIARGGRPQPGKWGEAPPITLKKAKNIVRYNPMMRKKNVDLKALHELMEFAQLKLPFGRDLRPVLVKQGDRLERFRKLAKKQGHKNWESKGLEYYEGFTKKHNIKHEKGNFSSWLS